VASPPVIKPESTRARTLRLAHRSADVLSAAGLATCCRLAQIQRTECPLAGSFQNESAPFKAWAMIGMEIPPIDTLRLLLFKNLNQKN
jgi:hypothetical protein